MQQLRSKRLAVHVKDNSSTPLFAVILLAGVYSCSGGGGGGGGALPPAETASEYIVYSNVNDPRVARATTFDGEVVEYYGLKDDLGIATSIYAVSVTDTAGTTAFELGQGGLPERVYAANGSRFDLSWDLIDSSVHIVGTSPSGEYAIAADAFFTPQPMPLVLSSEQDLIRRAGARDREVGVQPLVGGTPEGVVSTTISRCGLPASALQVVTNMTDTSNNEYIGSFPSLDQGGGVFQTTVPLGQTVISNTQATCDQIADILGHACTAFNALGPTASLTVCIAFSVAVDAATIPSGEAVLLSAACTQLSAALTIYCATLDQSAAPGAPSLASALCDAAFDNVTEASQVSLQTCVIALPSNICSSTTTISAATPVVVMNSIDMGGSPHVNSLSVMPQAPVGQESFTATAEVYCIPAGSTVELSVTGSDGSFDDLVFPFPSASLNEQFSIVVPGVAPGVRETIKVTVNLSTGEQVSRTLFVTIPALNLSGTWSISETTTSASEDCVKEIGESFQYTANVVQFGNSVTVSASGVLLVGVLSGDILSLSGSYPEDGGTTTVISTSLTFTANAFSGQSNWSWADDRFSCVGTSFWTGTRLN
jgi:hypothetical protein